MKYDANLAPHGWYVGSYLLRFVEVADKRKNSPKRRFLCWENTVIVKARDIGHAFEKVSAEAKEHTRPYSGGSGGIKVRWLFEGITELLPIYDRLSDGAEIMWTEHRSKSLKTIRSKARPKRAFTSPSNPRLERP
jgi:Domain of unknown function (DUF4288)